MSSPQNVHIVVKAVRRTTPTELNPRVYFTNAAFGILHAGYGHESHDNFAHFARALALGHHSSDICWRRHLIADRYECSAGVRAPAALQAQVAGRASETRCLGGLGFQGSPAGCCKRTKSSRPWVLISEIWTERGLREAT